MEYVNLNKFTPLCQVQRRGPECSTRPHSGLTVRNCSQSKSSLTGGSSGADSAISAEHVLLFARVKLARHKSIQVGVAGSPNLVVVHRLRREGGRDEEQFVHR